MYQTADDRALNAKLTAQREAERSARIEVERKVTDGATFLSRDDFNLLTPEMKIDFGRAGGRIK